MVMYWSRCDICGKYIVVSECTLTPGLNVCPHCCVLICVYRENLCQSPIWLPELKAKLKTMATVTRKEERVEKVLMDLLKRLEKK